MITAQNNMFSRGGGKYRSLLIAAAILCGAVAAQASGAWFIEGHTEVEYIQGNGKDARIVTDYIPNPQTDKIEAVVEWPANAFANNVNHAIWCACGITTTTDSWTLFALGSASGTNFRFDYKSTPSASLTPALATGTKYTVTAEGNVFTWSGGDSYTHTEDTNFTAAGGPLTLFYSYYNGTGNSPSNYGKHRLYSFKVWRSGELIHYFVPCKDSSGAATMVDICNNPATLTKSGTFTAGNDGHYYDDSLVGKLAIQPIPDQTVNSFDPCRPEFVVSNKLTGAIWTIGGDIASPLFDVEYKNNVGIGVAMATVIGKGEYEGERTSCIFTINATTMMDDNISTTDESVRRLMVDGRFVYIFTNAEAEQVTVARRSLIVKDVLLVGGGGAGGNSFGGGGGGGGVVAIDNVNAFFKSSDTIPFAVGKGGASGTGRNRGGNGGDSTFVIEGTTYVAKGGGGGGGFDQKAGSAGGSGGGGCCGGAGGAGTEGQGYSGANAGYASRAGGGGGAAQAGYVYSDDPKKAGNGGEGVASAITGEAVYYGGGGGGGGSNYGWDEYDRGFGGIGGGGDGVRGGNGQKGADGLGGGGGGSGWANNTYFIGGKGGSGTVILVVEPVGLDLLPIPDQSHDSGAPCRPEMVVSNTQNSATWTIGGDITSSLFDVEYENNDGIGVAKVTVVGKGDYAGKMLVGYFNIFATKFDDANISVADPSVRRRDIDGSYVYIFTNAASAKTVTVKRGISLTGFLLVGGGGGGGHTMAGGGGGGGVTNATGLVGVHAYKNDTFKLVIGAGGEGSTGQSVKGGNGRETTLDFGLFAVSAFGGGGGGSWKSTSGAKGACGGGGSQNSAGGAAISGFGFAGAAGLVYNGSASGGGGGAGHAGYTANTTSKIAGYGGEGVSNNITGAWVVYGGGGGGGGSSNGYGLYSAGLGGLGGGGDGARSTSGANGVDGLGGGGGGGGYSSSGGYSGGNGGSGIAVLVIKPADFEIDPIPEQKLVSGVCEPVPVVYSADGETRLAKDIDYTISYADNAQTGIATMTITGVGKYAGKSATFSFLIYEVFFAKPEVTSGGDGKSWATAMSVSNAIAAAAQSGIGEVWIKADTLSAPAISIVNNANLTIRGGFAGTETTLAERQFGALTVFDGKVGNTRTSSILLSVENAAGADLVIERIKFRNAKSNGFVKKGGGSLTVLDCVIEANGRDVGKVYGRGMNAQSDGFGTLVVSNCVFAGNRCVAGDTQYGGFGLYAKSFKNALVDDSLFVTNGYDLTAQPGKSYAGFVYARGSAILADGTPIYVRRSRFSGNCCPLRNGSDDNWCGGTIALHGACGGSVIENCALIGNTEYMSAGANGPSGGAIAVRMGGVADKLTVRNCTIAYNLTQASSAAGGITVARGSVAIENTILWNNRRYHITTLGYGKDVHVASGSSAAIRNSFVTSLDATDESLVGVTLDVDSVSALDPKLVTSMNDFESLLTYGTSSLYYTYTNPTIYEDLATMDAHLLSSSGYCVNGGAAGPATIFYSPAIDCGDPAADFSLEPAPNGGRINLGAYGNTSEASRTGAGTPSAEIDVTFPDNLTRPNVKIAMDSATAGGYVAQVRLVCSSGGVVLSEATYDFVTAGDILNYSTLPVYLQPGDSFTVAVTITVPGADSIEYSSTKTVTGELPPFYGKGGGANVIHVREGANCRMDGTSWTDAYPDLATALASVPDASKTEMWLAVSNDHMVASMTLAGSLTIRGGFTGVENTPQERPEGAYTWLDGFNCYFPLLEFSVPSGALLTVERIRFSHAKASGIRKTGAGNLLVRDCYFTDRKQSDWNLQGGGIYASGGTVSITNCQFVNLIDYSVNALSNTGLGGDGIYLSSCAQAYIDDCLFATNGIQFFRNKGAQARHTGSAAYINATPTVFRNCRFASNGAAIMEADGSAGTIHFKGASGGSKLINCALVGNSDLEGSQSAGDPVAGGTIVCNMSTSDATLDIENCTIAYNLTQGKWTGAGINVNKGTVNVKNSIVYGNVRNRNSDTVNAGADIEVKANGTMNISYTLVTGLTSNYIHAAEGGTLNIGIGVFAADPLFATTMDDFQSLFSTKDSTLPYLPQSARAACAALDVYPRTHTGYFKDGVRVRDPERVESPTIDAGDPKSDYSREPVVQGVGYHGRRVNLGAYGNTSEAALTRIRGFHIILR